MKEVNESKMAKEKADAEAKAKAEQEAAAAAAQQAQASQSQSVPQRQTPSYSGGSQSQSQGSSDPFRNRSTSVFGRLVVLHQYGRSLAGMVRARAIRRGHRPARQRSGVVIGFMPLPSILWSA